MTDGLLPPGAVGVWPGDGGFAIHEYEVLPPDRAWQTFTDELGRPARAKLTSRAQDVVVGYAPQLPAPGTYVIEVFIPAHYGRTRRADYHVTYHERDREVQRVVKVDQAASGGRWVTLGMYHLDPSKPGGGRVNATDFSDEDPPQLIAFAGIRWRPATPEERGIRTPSGVEDAVVPTERPAPTPAQPAPAAPPLPQTHQDVINAFIVAAATFDEKFTDWIRTAGLDYLYADRQAVYAGPPIRSLSGLSTDRLAAVAHALTIPRKELAGAAVAASRPRRVADGRTWGVHGSAGAAAPPKEYWDFWIRELTALGMRWYKQCDDGAAAFHQTSIFRWVLALRDAGITPVIRYQQSEQFPHRLADNYLKKMEAYAREGIIWAEIGNEPNLPWEWSPDSRAQLKWHNPEIIRIINENWLNDAEEALRRGVRPAYYAFAPTDWRGGAHPDLSSVNFYGKSFEFLAKQHRVRTREVFRRGAWLAVHGATYEQPPGFDPWSQGGRTWDMCLRGYEVPLRALQHFLAIKDVVIMSTEGGVFTPESPAMRDHTLNGQPAIPNDDAHAEATIRMFDYIETQTPLQAMMPWCLAVDARIGHKPPEYLSDGWYLERDGDLRARAVVGRLKQVHRQRTRG